MDAPAITIENSEIQLPEFVLQIPFFSTRPTLQLIHGANGSGKTTLLRVLVGLQKLSSGQRTAKGNLRIGYLPQSYRDCLLPWLSAKKNLGLLQSNTQAAEAWAKRLGILDRDLEKRPFSLSGGQCQRLALARECTLPSDVLVLDEPFASLDITSIELAGNLILETIERGTHVVLTSHAVLPRVLDSICLRLTVERIEETISRLKSNHE